MEGLEAALVEDRRFEYMKKRTIEDEAWRFACRAIDRRDENHVAPFVDEHAREPQHLTCFFPVEGLTVHREVKVSGATLIPAAAIDVPELVIGPDPGAAMSSAIGVPCMGTSNAAMTRRARGGAEHALRVLRAGLREHNMILDQQLRFRLGVSYWFSEGGGGWRTRPEDGFGVELNEALAELAMSAPISRLPSQGGTDVEQSANRALEWFERAQLAVDPLVEMLFLFFALEAILGNTSEGSKGEGLALRRAILSHKRTGAFTHPRRIDSLYGQVRSTAVHGGKPPVVSEDEVAKFAWDVRLAINEFLEYAQEEDIVRRGRLLKTLENDPVVTEIKATFLPSSPSVGWGWARLSGCVSRVLRLARA